MLKKLSIAVVTGSLLMLGTAAFALTLDEAKTNIDRQASEKKLNAQDHSQAVTVLQGLVDKGVPVEHAYSVVEASINQGIKGQQLAEIAKSIEAAGPSAGKNAATVATQAIQRGLSARQTVRLMNTFAGEVKSGVSPDKAADNATRTMDRSRDRNRDMTRDRMGTGMGSGTGPGMGGPRR